MQTRVVTILFCKNTQNAVKINNSPRFNALTAKRCKKYAVKIIFFSTAFHRISYENSLLNVDPGCFIGMGINRKKQGFLNLFKTGVQITIF